MGLAIEVGFLADMLQHDEEGAEWFLQTLGDVQAFLASDGLPSWDEPREIADLGMRPHTGSFPYSFLHYLRRAYAFAMEYPDDALKPTKGELTDRDDLVIADASSMMSSHLLCHSDCEGWYVPVEFDDPLFDLDEAGVPGGGMLGSSYALLDELRYVAPYLKIQLDAGDLSDAEAARLLEMDHAETHPFYREYCVFLALWEAASASIRLKSAIVFC